MSGKRRWIPAIAAAVVWTAVESCALRAQEPASPAGAPADQQSAQRDIQQLTTILKGEDVPQAQRNEAARRLASRETPETRQILREALVDIGKRGGQLAVALALADSPRPDISFKDPLFALLDRDRDLIKAGAQALANFKGNAEVVTRLANFANNPKNESVAQPVIRAIGTLSDKRAAEALMQMLDRPVGPNDNRTIPNTAADALADMTGLTENGRDVQRWQQWWASNRDKPDDQWRIDLLTTRAQRLDQLTLRHGQLATESQRFLSDGYKSTPDAQKPERLLSYLKSTSPEVRVIGTTIVGEDFDENRGVANSTKEQLRTMVGDSDQAVRVEVAKTLGKINDASALEPLLTQLAQEPDADVRASIARALAPMQDLRAVPALIKLLHDDAFRVAVAAAESLKDLGATLRAKDPAAANQAAAALKDVFDTRTSNSNPAAAQFRRAVVEAMVPLRSPDLLQTFYKLLSPREPTPVRRAALMGLGELGEPGASNIVVNSLDDPEGSVRLEAVIALGKTSQNFENGEILYRHLNPNVEPDASVREKAWRTLESLFPFAPAEQLAQWADRFKDEPERRLTVLQSQLKNLIPARADEQIAIVRQQIGETLMKLNRPDEAVVQFRPALEYWQAKRPDVTEMLTGQLMDALLKSKQYPDAIDFAAKSIAANSQNMSTMGPMIRVEAERLRDASDFQSALDLIEQTNKMNPPLASRYRDDLRIIENDVRQKLSEKGSANPQSARTASGM